jgi:hypothetical protein
MDSSNAAFPADPFQSSPDTVLALRTGLASGPSVASEGSSGVRHGSGEAIDHDQIRQHLNVLYERGDRFFLLPINEQQAEHLYKGKKGLIRTDQGNVYDPERLEDLLRNVDMFNRENKQGVAISVCAFTGSTKSKATAKAISVLVIDIDEKNWKQLQPDAQRPEEAIPAALSVLHPYGLVPHAIAASGHGLHLYFRIERIFLSSDSDRKQVEEVWFKLGSILAGSTDRHDLVSVIRLWGSCNRKGGEVRRTRLLPDHTDLDRQRYKLSWIATALEGVPGKKALRRTSKALAESRRALAKPAHLDEVLPVDPVEQRALDVALAADPSIGRLRAASREGAVLGETLDRSKVDLAYAKQLLKAGFSMNFVTSEIAQSAKAEEKGSQYVSSTVSRASSEVVYVLDRPESVEIRTFQDLDLAFSSLMKDAADQAAARRASSPSCGDTSLSNVSKLSVVSIPPGRGKTTGINKALSEIPILPCRLLYAGLFVHELFRHEGMINAGTDFQKLNLPTTHAELHARLDPSLLDGTAEGIPGWNAKKLSKKAAKVPAAFFLNAIHPGQLDRRQRDFDSTPPRALLTMPPREDFCLAGWSQRQLNAEKSRCASCGVFSCRANTNTGGSKSYSRSVPIRLVTHSRFEHERLFRSDLLQHDGVILDEAPQRLFRTPCIEVASSRPQQGRVGEWSVRVVDSIIEVLYDARERGALAVEVERHLERLRAFKRTLVHHASRRWVTFYNTKDRRWSGRKVHDQLPLMRRADLLEIARTVGLADDADDDGCRDAREAMLTLLDFCEDDLSSTFKTIASADFDRRTGARMTVCRPVSGWPELLRTHAGSRMNTMILDGTAGLDPRYSLIGLNQEESYERVSFPNTTIVLTSKKTVGKAVAHEQGTAELSSGILKDLRLQLPAAGSLRPKVLVITEKSLQENLQLRLDVEALKYGYEVRVEHFNNLRGRNDLRDADAVYFTHLLRFPDLYYAALGAALRGFRDLPGQWVTSESRAWPSEDLVRLRAMTCDLYQDAMRCALRADPSKKVHIW